MTRTERIRRNEAFRSRYEKAFYNPVKRALKKQISSLTDILKEQGPQAALSAVVIDFGMQPVIEKLYTTVGVAKANEQLSELRRLPKRIQVKRRTLGFNGEWTRQILEYFQLNLFNKVVLPISETTQEYIREIINRGTIEGWSIDRMVEEIEREDYLDGRVRRILRTEINRAINYGQTIGEQKYEFKTQKRWIAVDDRRTRPAHNAADNQTVEISGSFVVGGEVMQFPGDPNASGANTINCRCFMEFVPVRDANGRLIPKDGQPSRPIRVQGRLRGALQEALAELLN